ncbi:MAG: flagellar basal body L-ring protein FlgH [Pseudomonadota bacterium]
MNNSFKRSACGLLVVLAACTSTPATSIKQPMTARPVTQSVPIAHNGAIFQAGRSNAFFEDRHARNVGDVLTINIVEVTAASQSSSKNATHAGTITATTPTITGGKSGAVLLSPFGITNNTSGSLADKSAGAGTNAFSGTITVTVIEVLGNGNLLVGGEKQVAIDQSSEYIRFSGVINPNTITGTNTVLSTQVADAHVEYKGATHIDQSTFTSMLGRVFLSVLPF